MVNAIMPGARYGKLTVKAPARLVPGEWICSCTCGTLRSYTEFDIECISHCGCKLPQSQSKHYLVKGALVTARDIESIYGVKHQTFYSRIKAGWSPEQAATTPTMVRIAKPPRITKPRRTVMYRGELLTMQQLFRYSQVSYNLMYYRIRMGHTAADAIKPVFRPVNVKHEFQGALRTLREIAALTGVNYNTLTARIAEGMDLATAAIPGTRRSKTKE